MTLGYDGFLAYLIWDLAGYSVLRDNLYYFHYLLVLLWRWQL